MRRLALTALLLFSAVSLCLADNWNKTYTVTGQPELRVSADDAAVKVTTCDCKTITAHLRTGGRKIGPDGIRVIEHQTGNLVDIELKFPHRIHIGIVWSDKVQLEIEMPKDGNANLRTGDGSVKVSGLKGILDIDTGDGSVEIDAVDGELRAHTGDGHIFANGRFDDLKLRTGDGKIEATANVNSKITSSWEIQTSDGSVTLRVPDSLAADVELHTGDGSIKLDVPVATTGHFRSNTVSGKINGGGHPLTIHTGDGSIRLARS